MSTPIAIYDESIELAKKLAAIAESDRRLQIELLKAKSQLLYTLVKYRLNKLRQAE